MPQEAFAGPHTVEKLDKLEAYLKSFLNVFKNQDWARTVYFDAFAGTGDIPAAEGEAPLLLGHADKEFIVGSARRALALEHMFSEYIFVERSRTKAKELERLRVDFPDRADRIRILPEDANTALRSFCNGTDWRKTRAVVFLDPYGNQVEWETIKAVAATERVDLWYLFPAGLGVHRQIGRDGTVHYTHEASLNTLLGTSDWRQAFISVDESALDLFGERGAISQKRATPDSVTRFMVDRMKSVFKGGVLDEWLVLGSRGHHNFSLIFAWANPSEGAKKAGKIARAVMRSGGLGRPKRH